MFKELNSLNRQPTKAIADHLTLNLTHWEKWLKIDTSEKAINLTLPTNLPPDFYVIAENTGNNRVNFQTETGATYQGIFDYIGQKNGGVHLLFEGGLENVWRSHGLQGKVTLDSIDGVYANENVLNQTPGDKIFTYVPGSGFVFLPNIPYRVPENISEDHIIHPNNHGKEFLIDTTAGQITIYVTHTTDTGIIPGWTARFKNIGINNVFFDTVSGNSFIEDYHYLQPSEHIDLRYLDNSEWVYYGKLSNV